MRHPGYHLRPNKAADRFAFIEAIRRLERLSGGGLLDYTYHSLGGPYLEDFRLLYEFFPEIRMVSIDNDEETVKRQKFHLPCGHVKLELEDLSSYIAHFDPTGHKIIFWLDYTGLEYNYFEDFKALLGVVPEGSMVKITLRSNPRDYSSPPRQRDRKVERFRRKFENVMRNPSAAPPRRPPEYAYFLQEMIKVAAEQALPSSDDSSTYVPVSSFYYSDGTWMLTLTGVVWQSDGRSELEEAFTGWEFANLTWRPPRLIDVPILSTKERLHLQHLLPSSEATGDRLRELLGYLIGDDVEDTEAALEQYATFHRYSPYVLRGVP